MITGYLQGEELTRTKLKDLELVVPLRLRRRLSAAFTLVELLGVMAIIVIVLGVAVPVITGVMSAGDVSKAVYDISGILDQSRAYAMSNSTYVYVGFFEADATTSESGPQVAGKGRVSVAVVATRDGTSGYAGNILANWITNYKSGANLVTIGKVQHFYNIHLVDLGVPPANGGMERPPYSTAGVPTGVPTADNLADVSNTATTFAYPLGSTGSSAQYNFVKVVQFDPQGVPRIQPSSSATANPSAIVQELEVGLQRANGNIVLPLPTPAATGNVAAIQLDGVTGATHIYRP